MLSWLSWLFDHTPVASSAGSTIEGGAGRFEQRGIQTRCGYMQTYVMQCSILDKFVTEHARRPAQQPYMQCELNVGERCRVLAESSEYAKGVSIYWLSTAVLLIQVWKHRKWGGAVSAFMHLSDMASHFRAGAWPTLAGFEESSVKFSSRLCRTSACEKH